MTTGRKATGRKALPKGFTLVCEGETRADVLFMERRLDRMKVNFQVTETKRKVYLLVSSEEYARIFGSMYVVG